MDYKNFLTIRKQVFSFYLGWMQEKVFRFYRGSHVPPTLWYTMYLPNCEKLPPVEKTLWLQLKELSQEEKEKFKENIEVQEKVLQMITNRNEKHHYRCWLIQLTTGKGKSHVIMDIANYYQTNTLILCHNVKTLWEMREKFVKFSNIAPCVYGGWKKELGPVTIMTKKSFTMDFAKLDFSFWLCLIDEAPIWFSKKFWNALNEFFHKKKGVALYGLSGTPYKNELDQEDLEKYFGATIKIKGQENNGYNIIPSFTFLDYYSPRRYLYENPAEMRTALQDDNDRLQKQVIEIEKLEANCILILSDRVEETKQLYEALWGKKWGFVMTGGTKQKDDEENIRLAEEKIRSREKIFIIGTIQKCWVWVDIPFIDSVFLVSAIKFKATVIQSIGRALRKYQDKDKVEVYIWNDLPILRGQRTQKLKSIKEEYDIGLEKIRIQKL